MPRGRRVWQLYGSVSLVCRGLLVGSYLRLCQHLFGVPEKRRRKVVSRQSRLSVYVKPPMFTVVWREEQIRHSQHLSPVSGLGWTAKLCFQGRGLCDKGSLVVS